MIFGQSGGIYRFSAGQVPHTSGNLAQIALEIWIVWVISDDTITITFEQGIDAQPDGEWRLRENPSAPLTACAKDAYSALPTKSSNPAKPSLVSRNMPAHHEYLLFTEALRHESDRMMWRFMLLRAGSDQTTSASELIDQQSAARTELLAVIRGLEAIDGPANVRLFTSSQYIQRGFSRGLAQWRSQRWHWERFGRRVPIRDCDLWQRIDHALAFHSVQSQLWGEAAHVGNGLASDMPECPAAEVLEEAPLATSATCGSIVDDSAVLVVPKRRTRRNRVAAATRNTLGDLRRGVESLFEPTLLPAG